MQVSSVGCNQERLGLTVHGCHVGKKKGVKTKGKSKKTRRADEVEKAFKEADASADRAAARITQSQMLLALFEIFFRVLKQCTQSGVQAQQAQGNCNFAYPEFITRPDPELDGESCSLLPKQVHRQHSMCMLIVAASGS